jgi:hypothetical protein
MELIGIGIIGAGFALMLALPGWIRKRRRRDMGLEPFAEIDAKEFERARRDPNIHRVHRAADMHLAKLRAEGRIQEDEPLPRREKDWREDAPAWSNPVYYRRFGRRP